MAQSPRKRLSPVTPETVRDVLRQCLDPELGVDIVRLGLVYDVSVTTNEVAITMTLTTPACPLGPYFELLLQEKLRSVSGKRAVRVVFTFTPLWTPERIDPTIRSLFGRIQRPIVGDSISTTA